MIEFFDSEKQNSYASIYEAHITLNKSLLKYFKDAYKVRVGIDKNEKKVYIMIVNKDYAMSGEIPLSSLTSISISSSYARVCSRAVIEYICENFNLNIPEKKFLQFKASYDEVKRAVVIDLDKEVK